MSNQDYLRLKYERRRCIRAYQNALLLLSPLLLFYWTYPYRGSSDETLDFLNSFLPLYFIFATTSLAYQVVRKVQGSIWTPFVWFPAQSAVFFGFGPLVEVFGSEVTQYKLDSHFLKLTSNELFRAHKLSVSGVFAMLAGILVSIRFSKRPWRQGRLEFTSSVDPLKLGIFFVFVGGLFKYCIVKPAQWGMIDILIPGVLSNLSDVISIGFAIIAFCAARGSRKAHIILASTLPFHIFLSVLSLSKLEVIIAVLLPVLGSYLGSNNLKRLSLRLFIIGVLFAVTQPFVEFGRSAILQRTNTIDLANYSERSALLVDYVASLGEPMAYNEQAHEQSWWTRLSFAGPQIRAMELYDSGQANPQLGSAWMYFVPRVIWPDKPILYSPGLYLYRFLSQNDDGASNLGLSIYGDLYWQYGWAGVFIGCWIIGYITGALSGVSLQALRSREFLMMPYILLVLQIGLFSPNKFVINGVVGPIPILVFYYLVTHLTVKHLRKKNAKSNARVLKY